MKKYRIGLFIPCYIDVFYPQVGVATLRLLEKLGQEIVYPEQQTCCGQPLANSGSERQAAKCYENFVKNFSEYDYIVTPSGSCAYHVKKHFDVIPQTDEVRHVRETVYELCEFLTDILQVEDLNIKFPHRVGIHQSCHGLRGLKLASASELIETRYSKVRRLLEKAEGIEIIDLDRTDECCGFGGTFSIFEPDISVKMGRDRIADHERHGAEYITSYDMSCLMHMEGIIRRQGKGIKVIHVAEILNSN
ncbi:MAG: (Fe-S)-binding protein [Dysgonamonadaceae bacterium]|jgi:L-lactate dehydrogenase complex protein LldE|nr:(Fe-S)-binding protein [Dysgonamonadaceae bacterium]